MRKRCEDRRRCDRVWAHNSHTHTQQHMIHTITKQDQVTIAAARLASRIEAVNNAADILLDVARQTKGARSDVHLTSDTIQRTWAAYNTLGDADCKTRGAAELLEYSAHTWASDGQRGGAK